MDIGKSVGRYFQLKKKQKELEAELNDLRNEIMNYCSEQGVTEAEIGNYRVKIIHQERKEFDDNKLYEALPDSSVWRMISKADPAKISGMLKLKVISEEILRETFTVKKISVLQVDKK